MREASWESLVLVTNAGLQMERCAEGLGWSVRTVQWESWAREPIAPKKNRARDATLASTQKTSTQALPAMVVLLLLCVFSQVPSIFSQITDWGIAARTRRRRRVKLSLRIVHTACAAGGNTSGTQV